MNIYKKYKIFIQLSILCLPYFCCNIKFLLIPYIRNHEFKKIENYLKICNNPELLEIKPKISNNPKVSIISPVYNTGKFVLRLIKSIQYQNFKDLEIILIDDSSTDNSPKLIKKYQAKDERIRLIVNRKNKGTFSSRNIGILKSKGNYIMMPDPDDIILEDSLKYFYYFSMKYNLELLRFNVYLNYGQTFFGEITENLKSRLIYQPELSTYLFYGLGVLKQIDFNLCNKFIKREALIRGLNIIDKKDLNMYMVVHEDGFLNYILYRIAKSSYFLKKFGYYYIKNNYKKRRDYHDFDNIKFRFIHLMSVFNNSRNTKYEKDMTNEIFNRLIYKKRKKIRLFLLNKEPKFFIDAINILNQNDFFLIKYKIYLKTFSNYFSKHIKNI